MDRWINIVSTSDQHIGCNRLVPNVIPNNIRDILFPHLNDELDILFFAGDFYDTLLDLNSVAGYEAISLITDIINLAKKHNFIIRVLQGTFSHDRKQNHIFNSIHNNIINKYGDQIVKVVTNIDIEHIKQFDISVLYIPDDLPHKNTIKVVNQRLEDVGLEKVDFIINHGYFEHLLPIGIPHIPSNVLNVDVIGKYVKGCILNGHVHTPSVYKNVINNGSFDRIAHGEEEPKGFFKIKYNLKNSSITHEFIENTKATIFKTFDISKYDSDIDSGLQYIKLKIDELLKTTNTGNKIFVRIISDSDILRHSAVKYISENYSNIKASSKDKSKNIESSNILDSLHDVDTLPIISESNVVGMIYDFVKKIGGQLEESYIKRKLINE